jgi:hypothetical protein
MRVYRHVLRSASRVVLLLAASGVGDQSAHAAGPPTVEGVMEWARAEWARAQHALEAPGLVFEYSVRLYSELAPAAAEQLEREIGDRPDHPKRPLLEESQRRLDSGPDIARFVAWSHSPNLLRVNREFAGEPGFLDEVITPGVMWTLTASQLTIIDPASAPPNRDPRGNLAGWETDLGYFRFGGAHLRSGAGMSPVSAERRADGWHVLARDPAGLEIDFALTWDEPLDRGFINAGRYVRTPVPEAIGTTFVVTGWYEDAAAGCWLARQVEQRYPDGRPRQAWVLESVRTCTPEDLRALTTVPEIDGTDPVRGRRTFRAVYDFRPSARIRTVQAPDGDWRVQPLPGSAVAPSWLRPAGWGALGVLAAVFAALRLRPTLAAGLAARFRRKGERT